MMRWGSTESVSVARRWQMVRHDLRNVIGVTRLAEHNQRVGKLRRRFHPRHDNYRDGAGLWVSGKVAQDRPSVHRRQIQVQQNQRGAPLFD